MQINDTEANIKTGLIRSNTEKNTDNLKNYEFVLFLKMFVTTFVLYIDTKMRVCSYKY